MVKIVVDCFGGDRSPGANIDGALLALSAASDLRLILTGDEQKIKDALSGRDYDADRIEILHAPEIIDCHDKPTDAVRLKRESSMMKGIRLLREDDTVRGLVSTGSTGALVAASLLRIGRIPGVIRPAFCPVLPDLHGGIVGICDSGANVDITPDHLFQYAVMGSVYLSETMGVEKPRVGLLNVGAEAEKGDDLRKRTYPLLSESPDINFVGNAEGRDVFSGDFDLIVCDGFSGNVLIKSVEGTSLSLLKRLKNDIGSKLRYKLGALLMKQMFLDEKELMNYQNYGGSVMLGTSKTVVKGHGSSNARAVKECIMQAYRMENASVNEKIESILGKAEQTNA